MKSFMLFLLILPMISSQLNGQDVSVNVKDKFKVQIHGTSTMHDWTSDVTGVKGTASLDIEEETFSGIKNLQVIIPVKSIQSTKGSIMDKKTYSALKEDKYPNIKFQLIEMVSLDTVRDGYVVEGKGKLTIAGVTKTVTIQARAMMHGNSVRFTGSHKLKMTDFGIEPPTAMLGAMKTGDDVTITFDVTYQ